MRLLPRRESIEESFNRITNELDAYLEPNKEYNKLKVYFIVFKHSVFQFGLLLLVLIALLGVNIYAKGPLEMTFIIGAIILILIYEIVKHTVKWSNQFIIGSSENNSGE